MNHILKLVSTGSMEEARVALLAEIQVEIRSFDRLALDIIEGIERSQSKLLELSVKKDKLTAELNNLK